MSADMSKRYAAEGTRISLWVLMCSLLLAFGFLTSCSTTAHTGQDAGVDTGDVATDGDGDFGAEADDQQPDDGADLDDECLEFRILEHHRMCGWDKYPVAPESPPVKARVSFLEGVHCLSTTRDAFDADLVDRVELGPDGRTLVSLSSGRFTRDEAQAQVRYEFIQVFDDQGELYELSLEIKFELDGGVPVSRVRTLEEVLGSLSSDTMSMALHAYRCPEHYPAGRPFELCMANGDRIQYSEWCTYGQYWSVRESGDLTSLAWTRDTEQRVADDFFGLFLLPSHHCWGDNGGLVFFEEPLGSIAGLSWGISANGLNYLDQDGMVVEESSFGLCH
jgi:hypothetical protein